MEAALRVDTSPSNLLWWTLGVLSASHWLLLGLPLLATP